MGVNFTDAIFYPLAADQTIEKDRVARANNRRNARSSQGVDGDRVGHGSWGIGHKEMHPLKK